MSPTSKAATIGADRASALESGPACREGFAAIAVPPLLAALSPTPAVAAALDGHDSQAAIFSAPSFATASLSDSSTLAVPTAHELVPSRPLTSSDDYSAPLVSCSSHVDALVTGLNAESLLTVHPMDSRTSIAVQPPPVPCIDRQTLPVDETPPSALAIELSSLQANQPPAVITRPALCLLEAVPLSEGAIAPDRARVHSSQDAAPVKPVTSHAESLACAATVVPSPSDPSTPAQLNTVQMGSCTTSQGVPLSECMMDETQSKDTSQPEFVAEVGLNRPMEGVKAATALLTGEQPSSLSQGTSDRISPSPAQEYRVPDTDGGRGRADTGLVPNDLAMPSSRSLRKARATKLSSALAK